MKDEKMQSVIVTLSDGRRGVFSGNSFVTAKDRKKGVKVTNITFFPPKPLPTGYSFENVPFTDEVKAALLKEENK